jgi:hypothetical protein
MTNVRNFQTCTVCNVDVVLPAVLLVDVEAVEVTGQVISGSRVEVPVVVDLVVAGGGGVAGAFNTLTFVVEVAVVLELVGVVETLAAAKGVMPILVADLALDAIATSTAASASIASAAATRLATRVTASSLSSTVATATAVSILLARHGVPGREDLARRGLLLDAELGAQEVGIERVEADRVIAGSQSGDEGLILLTKASEHIAKDLLVAERNADGCHGISQGLHLVEVARSGEVLLLQVRELEPDLHDTRPVL